MHPRSQHIALLLAAALALAAGCGGKKTMAPAPGIATRTWFMGFSGIPPVLDQNVAVQAILTWSPRSDAAIAHEAVPWDSLLAGIPADSVVRHKYIALMHYYRLAAHLQIVFEIDPTNGLNRAAEDPTLLASGHHITEPIVQAKFREWAAAVDTILQPEYMGLASEVNLVRVAASPTIYAALHQMANETADSLHALHARLPQYRAPKLYAGAQVETAWGRLGPPGWQGVATERADFAFAEVWGLSSYPYLGGFVEPEEVPMDYYSRVANELGKPVMIVEGGWTSETVPGSAPSTPAKQARFLRRQADLLDAAHAIGFMNLLFANLALTLLPPPAPGTSVQPFAYTGMVDSALTAKPALAVWDSLFARAKR